MGENLFELEPEFPAAFAGGEEPAADRETEMPLAARLRSRSLDEYAGLCHLLESGKLLRRAIEADRFSSIILSGPSGTGKTSLAEVIARISDSEFVRLSGVTSSVADVRREIASAVKRRRTSGRWTILFIDEIHRFSRSQLGSLLPDVENGNIRLIGGTTHNPHFYVVGALLSRSQVFRLEPLSQQEIRTLQEAEASIQKKVIVYGDDGHYDTASAADVEQVRVQSRCRSICAPRTTPERSAEEIGYETRLRERLDYWWALHEFDREERHNEEA